MNTYYHHLKCSYHCSHNSWNSLYIHISLCLKTSPLMENTGLIMFNFSKTQQNAHKAVFLGIGDQGIFPVKQSLLEWGLHVSIILCREKLAYWQGWACNFYLCILLVNLSHFGDELVYVYIHKSRSLLKKALNLPNKRLVTAFLYMFCTFKYYSYASVYMLIHDGFKI